MSEMITMRLDVETAKAVQALTRVDKQTRKLNETVRAAAAEAKGQAAAAREAAAADRTRAAAAQSLQRQRSAALVGVHQEKESAAASLQRQRSAALQANMNRQIKIGESFELARMRAIHQASDAETRRQEKTAKTVDQFRTMRRASDQLGGSLSHAAMKMGAFVGASFGLQQVVGWLMEADRLMESIGRRNVETAKSGVPLASAFGESGLDLKMIEKGAEYGLDPNEVSELGIQIPTNIGATLEDFVKGAELTKLGVSPTDAGAVVTAGIARGIGAGRAADLTVAAAESSRLTPGEMSKIIPYTEDYSRMEEGLGIASGISLTGVAPHRIPELVRSASKELHDESKIVKKYGLQGLSESDKIVALNQIAQDSGDFQKFTSIPQLQKFGMDAQSAEAISKAIRQAGTVEQVERELTAMQPGTVKRETEWIEKNRPHIKRAWDADRADAANQANMLLGPEAEPASASLSEAQAAGIWIRRARYQPKRDKKEMAVRKLFDTVFPIPMNTLNMIPLTNEKGEANFVGKALYKADRWLRGDESTPEQVRTNETNIQADALRQTVERQLRATEENTKAINDLRTDLPQIPSWLDKKNPVPAPAAGYRNRNNE